MSQWTHISGCIRLDALILEPESNEEQVQSINKAFGNTCSYEDDRETWDSCTAPCGSEGSIQYFYKRTGTDSDLSWGTVTIWGDLRDYDNAQEIFEWVKKACDSLWIRQVAITVDIEYHDTFIIYDEFDGDKTQIKMKKLYSHK